MKTEIELESLEKFYKNKFTSSPTINKHDIGSFDVFKIEDNVRRSYTTPTYIRRDFYKIMLMRGENVFHYGDESIPVKDDTLLFFNPNVPYTYDLLTPETTGYFCVFKDEFFTENARLNINTLPLFTTNSKPIFQLDAAANKHFDSLFQKMIDEMSTDYVYKYELIRSYISEIIYSAIKLSTLQVKSLPINSDIRISRVFIELLERQFPIETLTQKFSFRTPRHFADQLSVHVNHLNRAVKRTTGKTTSEHIAERLTSEAKALLRHSNWNVAEISDVLGYEEQSSFNKFFKKQTHLSPSDFRTV